METAKQKRLLLWAGISVVLLALIIVAIRVWQRRPTLIDLQKEMLTAQTDHEKQEILEKLDQYYLTMPIPDAIRNEVEDSVDVLIQHFDPEEFTPEKLERQWANLDSNIYIVENQLNDILRDGMIARKLKDMNTFQTIMSHAERLADTVDTGTNNNYWQPWVVKVKNFDANMATDWLLADKAEKLCYKHHLGDFEKAEKFGGLALQLLQQVNDERLQLDVTQRLFVILRKSRGMYDLSYPLAEQAIRKAEEINYRLRATGLTFNYAVALRLAGYNHKALDKYFMTNEMIKTNHELPGMDYYDITTRLDIAMVYRLLGKYDKSLSICEEIEKLPLDNYYKHILYNTRGITYIYLGKYDSADAEYQKALNYAIADNDTVNQYVILCNIGKLFFRLTEYDKASAYYQDAMSLLLKFNPENLEKRSRILISIAEVEADRKATQRFNVLTQEAEELIERINNPAVRAEYLVSIAQLNIEMENFQQAHNYSSQAINLVDAHGMLKYAMEARVLLIQSLIGLSDFKEAKRLLHNLYILAVEFHDAPVQIDVLGLSSHIAYKQGNTEQAIQKSNLLIDKVEEISTQISDPDILITFRQKVNPYLKEAVIYELAQRQVDSAFVRLDYLKACEVKRRLTWNGRVSESHRPVFVNIDSLRRQLTDKRIVINYLAAEDTLFAFVLDRNELHLFERAIHIDELRHLGNNYIKCINNGRKYLDPYQPAAFEANYDSVLILGQQLYGILLDWPGLKAQLQHMEITYVIPDDILYGIPFSCLIAPDESPPQFLIQKTSVVNLPSAVSLQTSHLQSVAKNFENKKVLICADLQEFPRCRKLVNYIKNKFPKFEELIIDKSKIENEDVLSRLNRSYDIYFFIGHSQPNLKFPDLSNFQLSPRRRGDEKAIRVDIPLRDLKRLDWSHAEMVFFIGCETAVGKLYEGSGFSGFQQTALAHGAKNVMASLWKIDNNRAFQQVKEFLDSWENQHDPAIALQQIEMKWIRRLQEDAFYGCPQPYLWKILNLSQAM